MKNIHIENSYRIWRPKNMKMLIIAHCVNQYVMSRADRVLNRSYFSMYCEWWYHNIAYYISKPFCFLAVAKAINERARNVDLEEWRR